MGIFFKPDMQTSHALSFKDSSQYWQMAAESVGMDTESPSGEAILLRAVPTASKPKKDYRSFLPELVREDALPPLALAS